MIKIPKRKHKFVLNLFGELVESGAITEEESSKILSHLSPLPFDWKRVARYSLWIAVISLFISIANAFSDRLFIQLLSRLFSATAAAKMVLSGSLAAFFFTFGVIRRNRNKKNVYTNESIMFLGVLATAGAIFSFGELFETDSGHFSFLILLASLCYGVLGLFLHSPLIWCFALLSLGSWLGAETGYLSGWGAYYLGLNYPLRFVLFGLVSLFAATALRDVEIFQPLYNVTRNIGLLYLFIALWIMSIFGNYGDLSEWYRVKQIELFHWSLLFAFASFIAIYLGCKWDEGAYRGFGLTFLFINLYTRYFELFWNSLHSTLFFFLLGVSLWYIGSKAENIWLQSEIYFLKTIGLPINDL